MMLESSGRLRPGKCLVARSLSAICGKSGRRLIMGSRRYHRVVFESSTILSDSSIENLDILREAMRANDRDGIASVMIKAGPRFVQMIEGPAQPVQATYARIREDRRHFRVETLIDMPIVSPSLQGMPMFSVQVPARPEADGLEILSDVLRTNPELRSAVVGEATGPLADALSRRPGATFSTDLIG
ncbi:BLUF domain-containing protein [Roseivivax marinus]|uniref:BLUF domain-containing protein n=1 Tax=Roseivivax marinus TaxID=1379903 RepID=UPI00158769FD|nr:BLUF domain-containing protein [Roseivivax marinus]